MLLSFLKDINAVIFAVFGLLFIMPSCILLSVSIYFLRITEEGWRGAFTPAFVRLVVSANYGVIGAILLVATIIFLGFAYAYSKRPIVLDQNAPKFTYNVSSEQPALPDETRRRFQASPHRTIAEMFQQVEASQDGNN